MLESHSLWSFFFKCHFDRYFSFAFFLSRACQQISLQRVFERQKKNDKHFYKTYPNRYTNGMWKNSIIFVIQREIISHLKSTNLIFNTIIDWRKKNSSIFSHELLFSQTERWTHRDKESQWKKKQKMEKRKESHRNCIDTVKCD